MPKYIELEKALHVLDNVMSDEGIKHKGKAIRKRLNELPGEDVVEVEHGEWKTKFPPLCGLSNYCSECGQLNAPFSYCPSCGAKMDKKEGAGNC